MDSTVFDAVELQEIREYLIFGHLSPGINIHIYRMLCVSGRGSSSFSNLELS